MRPEFHPYLEEPIFMLPFILSLWFSSSESQPSAVNLVTPEQCQRCPTLCHSQGDVAQKVNSKSTNNTNIVDIVNKSPPSRPRVRYAENVTRLETQRSFNSIPPELCASPSSVKISTRSGRTYFRI
ncbi:hypothetical protein CEXT_291751 [Caerostris extrusa]|uniref:Uncharacterized protein n=1 Tax=Caerostris extrusa TaxID=172846 RepID=A0AAV4YE71_CAEEX|nr:hypothetical protein CEXT_291751 [Caerostris extrusa]